MKAHFDDEPSDWGEEEYRKRLGFGSHKDPVAERMKRMEGREDVYGSTPHRVVFESLREKREKRNGPENG